MGGTKRGAPPAPRQRTKWQLRRERALLDKGYRKADVVREVARRCGKDAPSDSAVRAVLDGRYRDDRVASAFVRLLHPSAPGHEILAHVARYFPPDEPPYHGPG